MRAMSCRFRHRERPARAFRGLPYTSDAERARSRSMTFRAAIALVMQREGCTKREALRQIRAAIGDGKLFARWEDERPDHGNPDGIAIRPDRPPGNGYRWRDSEGVWHVWDWQRAVIRGDTVLDPWTGRVRVVLLLRFLVESIWPEQPPTPPPAKKSRPKGGRPTAKAAIYATLNRLHSQGHDVTHMAPKRLAELVANEHGNRIGGDAGWSERVVRDHIRQWRLHHPD